MGSDVFVFLVGEWRCVYGYGYMNGGFFDGNCWEWFRVFDYDGFVNYDVRKIGDGVNVISVDGVDWWVDEVVVDEYFGDFVIMSIFVWDVNFDVGCFGYGVCVNAVERDAFFEFVVV